MFILSRKDWGIRRILNICFDVHVDGAPEKAGVCDSGNEGLADGWMQRTASSIQRLRSSLRSSLDHMEYLGGTVTQIAGEKAGILKNMPVVYDDTDAAASAVIRNRAAELSNVRHIRSARQCIRIFGGNMAG